MTATAIVLLLIAALAHATWNLLGKRGRPSGAFFLMASLASIVLLSPLAIVHREVLNEIPSIVWLMLLATGVFQSIYYIGLGHAYRLGHLSIAYPLARAMPVLLVTAFSFLIGRGEQIGVLALVGMALIGAGCFLLPMQHFSDLKFSNYLHASSAMALVAAIGTCGYSLIDSAALHHLRASGLATIGKTPIAFLYLFFEMASTAIILAIYVSFSSIERTEWRNLGWRGARSATIAAALITAAYGMALVAMGHVSDVSYVVAFRQISIPIGVFLGIVLLDEPCPLPKAAGVFTLMAGLAMVALG